ncbi:glucose-6-phosphate isomerase [Marinibactrum halimedae]|uniref:Glucose-6-phosphate isomerase n=1 Tax=Marinibactrum halimedae TaxID=1444977 RepID=A0AA37WNC1_9GAMM|nr:glucose-6-phosphate isomerase [Marinibactrum halimedae]MCD9457794.1 glucose-6-phosphate isomerase [Marinibactrum halimedae]GLS24832.1 glucose-6-phosphate isomerase [Marinibactrum halimedae]
MQITGDTYTYPSWSQLLSHKEQWQTTLAELFVSAPTRTQDFSLQAAGLYLDYSKNHLTAETLGLLTNIAKEAKLPEAVAGLLGGDIVNNTENRPALHTALRFQGAPSTPEQEVVAETLEKMSPFVRSLHDGEWLGQSGKPITDVVNIGIGGSDLGPRMVVTALADVKKASPQVHFVANIDGADLSDVVKTLNPETTLFIVASKSFSTLETRENALAAREWVMQGGCAEADLHKHFVAVSSNIKAAVEFGIAEQNIFPMWDWVGGRYSLWSAIGLPIAIAIGMDGFQSLLKGANAMDQHFAEAPIESNMPMLMALITFWYSACWGYNNQAILPYAQRMSRLPAYLQQLDMESLGKQVDRNGQPLKHHTGLVLWGTEGTNGQHSFHQLLHQGTQGVLVDFIGSVKPMSPLDGHHTHLMSNCIAQSQALLTGKSLETATKELLDGGASASDAETLAPHKVIPGNRPSNTLLLEQLNPESLGALIALYEHKVFCLGTLWGLNPYDQWGVELGKQLGAKVYPALTGEPLPENWDGSTKALVELVNKGSL